MASRIFGSSNNGIVLFEIRLRESLLVFRGTEEEAEDIHLVGTLVLCLTEPLKVESVRLRFTGERRSTWGNDGSKGKLFHRFDWRYISSRPFRGKILEAGNYEWHFDHVIAGDMPESVEGRSDSYLIYRLRATIDRGFLSHNIIDRKHVRIIRTLNPAADPLCHETALTGNWEGKINYKIWIPTIGVVFGTTLIVWFRIAPLVKGLRLSKIHLSILETEWVHIRGRRLRARCHRPVKDMYTFPEDQETEVFSGLDCWVFPMQLNLPTALRECRQSVTVEGFHIQHAAEFTVRFVNPDGHMSELRGGLSFFLYISRFLHFDENNEMIVPASGAIDPNAFAIGPAPTYEERQHDLLFDGISCDGYLTPVGGLSGANTPFYSQSQRGSADNLASLSAISPALTNLTGLQRRLSNVENTSVGQDAPAATTSSEDSQVHQARVPDMDALLAEYGTGYYVPQVHHYEYSQEELARIPSYRTALRSPRLTRTNEMAPCYHPTGPGATS